MPGPAHHPRPPRRRRDGGRRVHRCPGRRRAAHCDRGAATIIGVFLVTSVLALAATLLEIGNTLRVTAHATHVAQQAARAGATQLDLPALRRGLGPRLDPAAARSATETYLRAVGETGSVRATPAQVSVTVTVTRPRVLLPLIGITTVTVTASATAIPVVT